ncbi:hypothetical protein Lal_00001081 [Lupinus albus]|nr:hypothetical protein Lal_00001081 [Lupinus albus]
MTEQKTETALSSDATEVRRQKLALLREKIGDVYPAHFHRTMTNAELAAKYESLEPDVETTDIVTVAGRVYSSRNSGMFMDIRDASGKVQIFSHKDTTPEAAREMLSLIDIGDIIGVTGVVRRTKRGELTINAHEITMLTKSLLPMPEKWHGVSDIELRYRKRHLDIMSNDESKLRFQQRSKIVSGFRRFLESEGFLEVETPMLQTVYGGATADPFKTFHNTLKMDMYLRIAPELFLKRTLVSGLSDKVFEINRNFRNEGVSTRHNPEFTMMECYWAYADYEDMMALVERLFENLATTIHGTTDVVFGDKTLSFKGPFKRVPMPDAVKEATGIDFLSIKTDEEARAAAKAAGFEVRRTGLGRMPRLHLRRKGRGHADPAEPCDAFPEGHLTLCQGSAGRTAPRGTLRDLLQRLGSGQRLLGIERSGRTAPPHGRATGAGARARREGQAAGRRVPRCHRPGHAACRWSRHRRRPPHHAVNQRAVDPRRDPLSSPPQQGGLIIQLT